MTERIHHQNKVGLEQKVSNIKMSLTFLALDSAVGAEVLNFSYLSMAEGNYRMATTYGIIGTLFCLFGYKEGKKVLEMYREEMGGKNNEISNGFNKRNN